ncbi:hypothetical protein B5F76_02875 [Desulfovibrio sp. An276]|nr:hypothetical protein B5F76_02875 [Desulfovibrio sp. An276]
MLFMEKKMLAKRMVALCLILSFSLMLSACYTLRKSDVQHNTVPVPEVQYIDLTIIEGKTTKQEILDAAGIPDDISESSMTYSVYKNKDIKIKLQLVQKDGIRINTIVGEDEKHQSILIFFAVIYKKNTSYTTNIVDSVSL